MTASQSLMASLLCRVGLHRWETVGFRSLVMPMPVERCLRCGRGRCVLPYAVETFTREQMENARVR